MRYCTPLFVVYFIVSCIILHAQTNTNYSSLFTTSTFVKTIDQNLPVGTVVATNDVSGGSSSYSIPISVPPGTNGVAPSLVVSYNSNAGNGMLGQGWTLSGLSMITRSTKNLYLDNKTTPVELTLNDVFALDGQRLLLKTGTYGLNGATYATESESFSFVTSYGQSGQGPTWFQIETKEGVVYEYGNSTTSRFLM